MTSLTIPFRIVAHLQVWLVNVLVTVNTFLTDVAEQPSFRLFMAGKTRRCQMCTIQGERTLLVLPEGVCAGLKSLHRMAAGTIFCFSLSAEIPLVIICMAMEAL